MEEDAKKIIVQILNVMAFCHLQGVVHRDLKPEVWYWQSIRTNILLFFQLKCFGCTLACACPFVFLFIITNSIDNSASYC